MRYEDRDRGRLLSKTLAVDALTVGLLDTSDKVLVLVVDRKPVLSVTAAEVCGGVTLKLLLSNFSGCFWLAERGDETTGEATVGFALFLISNGIMRDLVFLISNGIIRVSGLLGGFVSNVVLDSLLIGSAGLTTSGST